MNKELVLKKIERIRNEHILDCITKADEFAIFDVKNNVAIQYGTKEVLEKRLLNLNK